MCPVFSCFSVLCVCGEEGKEEEKISEVEFDQRLKNNLLKGAEGVLGRVVVHGVTHGVGRGREEPQVVRRNTQRPREHRT
jgi:hypothetical protein